MGLTAGDLIITNGDCAGNILRRALPGTEVLPWRDVLNEGPVPRTDTLAELTALRAEYLAGDGGELDLVRGLLDARDRGLAHSAAFKRVVLWFEHDLYDQLQLLQLLDWFHQNPLEGNTLRLVQAGDFLGNQTPESILAFRGAEREVTAGQLSLASEAWDAFRAPTPELWAALLERDLSNLPFLKPAVRRMLEELPGPNGLSRTEQQMLEALAPGNITPPALFAAVQQKEEAVFIGDLSFWRLLDGLALADEPLVEGLVNAPFRPEDAEARTTYLHSGLRLTPLGEDVQASGADHAAHNRIDRWWGGTHLTNEALWRFDPAAGRLLSPS
jgi:hypothetical protein